MDSSSKKVLVGPQAPTAANLATWLKENPNYHVVYKKVDKTGKIIQTTGPKLVKIQSKTGKLCNGWCNLSWNAASQPGPFYRGRLRLLGLQGLRVGDGQGYLLAVGQQYSYAREFRHLGRAAASISSMCWLLEVHF